MQGPHFRHIGEGFENEDPGGEEGRVGGKEREGSRSSTVDSSVAAGSRVGGKASTCRAGGFSLCAAVMKKGESALPHRAKKKRKE